MESIGSQIKNGRRKEGLTQTELAELMGCSVNTISRWENDKYSPTIDELKKISNILNVDFSTKKESEDSDINNTNQELVSVLEDMRLEIVRIEREKRKQVKIFTIVILVLIIAIFIFMCFLNWRNPKDSHGTMEIEYFYEEG